MTDPAELTARLIRCPSVTPRDAGAIPLLEDMLTAAGFTCTRVERGGILNLYARWGEGRQGRRFGFNGHTDVVPVGDPAAWSHDPFGAEEADGWMYGRGAVDMKSGVAAFVAAAIDFVSETPPTDASVILAITGDEEGDAADGTRALLDWMAANGERMDACVVGEPTCPETFGEMIKIGRRGSLTAHLTAHGRQGHTAYPHRALNPLPALVHLLDGLARAELDAGSGHFDPSTLALTTVDVGNAANNVIPAAARATLNIRYNDLHSGETLEAWLRDQAARAEADSGVRIGVQVRNSGESFVTPPGPLSALVAGAVAAETGVRPVLSTTGGTSDARFVRDHCPVVEFGLVGQRMHAVDERVAVAQIHALKAVYGRILSDYLG